MTIEPGVVVVLKSGGPLMTVEELGEHVDAKCCWFSRDELRSEWLPLATLKIAPEVEMAKPRGAAMKGVV